MEILQVWEYIWELIQETFQAKFLLKLLSPYRNFMHKHFPGYFTSEFGKHFFASDAKALEDPVFLGICLLAAILCFFLIRTLFRMCVVRGTKVQKETFLGDIILSFLSIICFHSAILLHEFTVACVITALLCLVFLILQWIIFSSQEKSSKVLIQVGIYKALQLPFIYCFDVYFVYMIIGAVVVAFSLFVICMMLGFILYLLLMLLDQAWQALGFSDDNIFGDLAFSLSELPEKIFPDSSSSSGKKYSYKVNSTNTDSEKNDEPSFLKKLFLAETLFDDDNSSDSNEQDHWYDHRDHVHDQYGNDYKVGRSGDYVQDHSGNWRKVERDSNGNPYLSDDDGWDDDNKLI